MTSQELYINNRLVTLDPAAVLALNFAVNTLFDMSSVQGNISNKVILPPTNENRAALGFIDDINVDLSQTARKRNTCKYIQNGIEIIPAGTVDVGVSNTKGIEITITSGNIDFFDQIDKGNINELNLSGWDHPFTSEGIIASFTNTEGYVYPLLDYGNLTDTPDVELTLMRPAVFWKTVVDQIVKEAGFKLDNQLETNKATRFRYNNLLFPFSNNDFSHAARGTSGTNNYLKAYNYDNKNYTAVADNTIEFPRFEDPSGSFQNNIYTAKSKIKVDIDFKAAEIILNDFRLFANNEGIDIRIYKNSDVIGAFQQAQTSTTVPRISSYKDASISCKAVNLAVGDQVKATVKISSQQRAVQMQAIISLIITPSEKAPVIYGENVEIEAGLPDISKKDFVKAVASMFCAIVQSDNVNKIVHIVPFGSIIENAYKARDWSAKVVNIKDSEAKEIKIGDYGQANTAEYKNDDVIKPDDYAWGTLTISDENLKSTNTLFSLPFSASVDVVKFGISMMQIAKIDPTKQPFEFSINTGARAGLRHYASGTSVNFKRGSVTYVTLNQNIPVAYFAPDLLMQNVLTDYYGALNRVLADQRKLTVLMFLTEVDIKELDFFTPVYLNQYSSFFYISQIKNFIQNRASTVELVKLY